MLWIVRHRPSGSGSSTPFSVYRAFFANGALEGSCAAIAAMYFSAKSLRHARSHFSAARPGAGKLVRVIPSITAVGATRAAFQIHIGRIFMSIRLLVVLVLPLASLTRRPPCSTILPAHRGLHARHSLRS